MEKQNNRIDRSQPVLTRLKQRLSELKNLISDSSPKNAETAIVMKAIDDIGSLIFNEPEASEYGLSVEQMMTLAESQIKTSAHNTELQDTNRVLQEYIIGLEQRLTKASEEAMNLLKKKGL